MLRAARGLLCAAAATGRVLAVRRPPLAWVGVSLPRRSITARSVLAAQSDDCPGRTPECGPCPGPVAGKAPPCWSCGAASFAPIFCRGCRAVQPPGHADYFTIFNMPRTYEVDCKQLECAFRELQRKLHPDVVAHRPDTERRYGSAQSMAVNAAYDTLRDPLNRALYLVRSRLRLEGQELDEALHISDPEFLEEQFEARMALAEGGEAAQQIAREAASRLAQAEREMADAFRSGDRKFMRDAAIKLCYAARLERLVRGVELSR